MSQRNHRIYKFMAHFRHSKSCIAAGVFCGWLLASSLILSPARAAPPERRARHPMVPWHDPTQILDRLFGPEDEVDDRLLAKIQVSAAEERRVGKQAVEAYLQLAQQQQRIATRGKDVHYLSELVQIIHPMMQQRARYRNIETYLILSDQIEARSFPGGFLVFSQGLLDVIENEAALIGIVAHELSHLDRGHHTRRIQRVKYGQQSLTSGQPPRDLEDLFNIGSVTMRAWVRPFQTDLEREADLDGARWSHQAGYDCRELGKFFLRLENQQGQIPMPAFFRSHPSGPDRHRAILREYQRLERQAPNRELHIGRENLEQRTVKRQK